MPRNAVGKINPVKNEVYTDDEGLKIELDFPIRLLLMIGGKMLVMYFKDRENNKKRVAESKPVKRNSVFPKLFEYRIGFAKRMMTVDVTIYYAGGVGLIQKKTAKKEPAKTPTLEEIKSQINDILARHKS
jgi:hypothetical protein